VSIFSAGQIAMAACSVSVAEALAWRVVPGTKEIGANRVNRTPNSSTPTHQKCGENTSEVIEGWQK
jgi:hypothetical protein